MYRYKILVVDDEKDIRSFLEAILSQAGYDVICLDKPDNIRGEYEADPPDLALLDINYSGDADGGGEGIDAVDLIKRICPGCPVILISGYCTTEQAVKAMKNGAYDIIEKPFSTDIILENIKKAISEIKKKHKK